MKNSVSDPIETYNYDRLGNRTSLLIGLDNYDYDYYEDMNRLDKVTKGTDKTEFTYNVFGKTNFESLIRCCKHHFHQLSNQIMVVSYQYVYIINHPQLPRKKFNSS